jgi:hypothetical protein
MISKKLEKIYREEVVGVPQDIEPTDFSFSEPSANAQKYNEIVARRDGKQLKKFGPFERYELIHYPNNTIVGLDRRVGSVVYYARYKTVCFMGHKYIAQAGLWAHPVMQEESSKAGFFSGQSISTYVCFEVLLNIHRGILVDTLQTMTGKRFWFKRTLVALDRGLHVSLIDQETKSIIQIKTIDDLTQFEPRILGEGKSSSRTLLMIAKQSP